MTAFQLERGEPILENLRAGEKGIFLPYRSLARMNWELFSILKTIKWLGANQS